MFHVNYEPLPQWTGTTWQYQHRLVAMTRDLSIYETFFIVIKTLTGEYIVWQLMMKLLCELRTEMPNWTNGNYINSQMVFFPVHNRQFSFFMNIFSNSIFVWIAFSAIRIYAPQAHRNATIQGRNPWICEDFHSNRKLRWWTWWDRSLLISSATSMPGIKMKDTKKKACDVQLQTHIPNCDLSWVEEKLHAI